MKKIFLTISLITINFLLNAQVSLKSDLIPNKNSASSIISNIEVETFKINENFVVVSEEDKGSNKGYWVKVFDKDFKEIKSYKYEMDLRDYNRFVFSVKNIDGKISFIEQIIDKKDKSINYIEKRLDIDTFTITEKKLLNFNDKESKSIKNFIKNQGWAETFSKFKSSINNKYHTFLTTFSSKDENYKLIHVFDEKMEFLYSTKLSNSDKGYVYLDTYIDENTGAVIILSNSVYWKVNAVLLERFEKDITNKKYIKFKETILDKETLKLTKLNEGFFLTALYFNEKNKQDNGVYLINMSNNLNVINEKTIPFDSKQLFGNTNKKMEYEISKRLELRDVLVDANENIYVSAEFRFIQYSNSMYNPVLTDVIMIKFNKDFKMLWNTLIEKNKKKNITDNNRYDSCKSFLLNNNLYLALNSDIGGYYEHNFSQDKRILLLSKFSENGKFNTIELNKGQKNDLNLSPFRLKCLDDDIIFYGISKEGYQLMKIKL